MKRPTLHFLSTSFHRAWTGIAAAALCPAIVLSPGMVGACREPGPSPSELTKPGESTQTRISADRPGSLQTSDGLTLRLTTDLGSVKVVPLEKGAAPACHYTVHIETDARTPLARHLLDHYSLSAKSTSDGVEITGNLPPQSARLTTSGAQFSVQFDIEVPPNYNVEVKTEAGDIETGDIGGIASLMTQGGNIRAGRIGIGTSRNSTSGRLG